MPRVLSYELVHCPVDDLTGEVKLLIEDDFEPLGAPVIVQVNNINSRLYEMTAYQCMVKLEQG